MARHHNEACPSPSKEYFQLEKVGQTFSNSVTCRCVIAKPTQLGSNKKDVVLLATFPTNNDIIAKGKAF